MKIDTLNYVILFAEVNASIKLTDLLLIDFYPTPDNQLRCLFRLILVLKMYIQCDIGGWTIERHLRNRKIKHLFCYILRLNIYLHNSGL
jgi:hypothetical protein